MVQEEQQVNVVDWLIEQMKQHRDVNSIHPIELINLKYEAIKIYNEAMHEEFKRGLHMGNDIAKKIWGDK